jgi:hypothetical protein
VKKFVPEFGKVKEKQQLDDNTTVEVENNYQNHNIIGTKLHYEERFRVGSMAEARDKVDELTMRIEKDEGLINPSIQYDGRAKMVYKGSFDVVFKYTKLGAQRNISQ